jgi:hypothetical protein
LTQPTAQDSTVQPYLLVSTSKEMPMLARSTALLALIVTAALVTIGSGSDRACTPPVDPMLPVLPHHPGLIPNPKWPDPLPLPEPAPWPIRPRPGLIPDYPVGPVLPHVPARPSLGPVAFDGTDDGCTKIPGQDKHPQPNPHPRNDAA